MYKLACKFFIITAVLTAACMILAGGHSSAATLTDNCPGAPYGNWGNDSDGEGSGVMSSVIMRARDESGNPLNPQFTMHSSLPGGGDQNQIYHWPVGSGGSVNNTDDWPQHGDFQFGTTMHNGAGSSVQCNGWVVMGPGTSGHVGNGWVLNCHSEGPLAQFWVSHLDNPGGQDGRWEMQDANGNTLDNDINSGASAHIQFKAVNGSNMRFTFVWHPTPGPIPTPEGSGRCTYFTETGSKYARKEVHITGVSSGTGKSDWDGNTWTHSADFDEYTPAPVGSNVNPGTYTKEWWYRPTANIITVTVNEWDYDSVSGTWPETTNSYNVSCYSATCSINWVDGNGPWNGTYDPDGSPHYVVIAGGPMYIHGTFTNTSPAPDNLTMWAGAFLDGPNGANYLGFVPTAGNSYPFEIDGISAPGAVPTYNTSFTPQYNASESNMSGCPMSVPVYQHFVLEPHSTLTYKSAEDPDTIGYSTYINNNVGVPVTAPTRSTFTSIPYGGGGVRCPSVGPVSTNGPYNPGGPNYVISPASCKPPFVAAGDQYCSEIVFTGGYNEGYVGPDGSVVPTALSNLGDKHCFTVINKPYFKAYNGGVSAGGGFKKADGSCSSGPGGGILAGWNDNTGGADRGASSQLSALAMIKITGFASAQTSITRSPTDLTFANTIPSDISSGIDSPGLGGNFSPGGSRCLSDVLPPTGATTLSGASTPANRSSGAYVHNGNLTITGGSLGPDNNVSYFVNGDAYISGNITYNNWPIGHAPSFVLKASGNIYIDPSVTELDGLYIAKNKIYTCGVNNGGSFAPVAVSSLHGTCNNQLVIYGNFIAKQLNLLRTFGSLRDEKPTPGTPAIPPTPPVTGAKAPLLYSSSGPIAKAKGCVNLKARGEFHQAWKDNYLCPNGNDASLVKLGWTNQGNTADLGNQGLNNCTASWGSVLGSYDRTGAWSQSYLCSNLPISFTHDTQSGRLCTFITEPASIGWPATFVCIIAAVPASPGTPARPPQPPVRLFCSNKGRQTVGTTCAAEVFEFNPALYISSPSIQLPSNGAVQYDSITSLPPVL